MRKVCSPSKPAVKEKRLERRMKTKLWTKTDMQFLNKLLMFRMLKMPSVKACISIQPSVNGKSLVYLQLALQIFVVFYDKKLVIFK